MHLLHKGIPGTEITGTVRRLQRSYATVKSVLPGYLSRAETACGEGISQEIVKERKVQTTNRLGRDMLRAGYAFCQRRGSGFAFFMVTTRADGGKSIAFGGRRWG